MNWKMRIFKVRHSREMENSKLISFIFFSSVVNVYTTHMPEISSTLPTIIMQDESVTNTLSSSTSTIRSRISVPGEQPPLSLLGDDPIKQSYSDDACSSEERSDIEIDI